MVIFNIIAAYSYGMSCEDFKKKFDDYKKIREQKKLFGTFGFRGVFGEGISAEKAERLGASLAVYLGEGKTIAIGKDPRNSSDILQEALINGIRDHGCNVLILGIITPNMLSLEVERQADAGVMITASHNPPEYNGIKCLSKYGMGFSPEEDLQLERIYYGNIKKMPERGNIFSDNGANERYLDHIVRYVKNLFPAIPLKIAVDGGGGSASSVTPAILETLGYTVTRFNCRYDGMFRERNPEPTDANLEKLKKLVLEENADFGVAHDGDGDRTAFVDENGRFIQGDVSAAIIADCIIGKIKDHEKKIAVTVAFSNIIKDIAKVHGAELIYTPVGEPYLAQAKLLCGAQIGLEEHGSVLLEWSREGPMLAGVMAGILSKEKVTLSELVASYPGYYQIKDAKTLAEGTDMKSLMDGLMQVISQDYERATDIDGLRVDYADGWFLVRASGTEPKVRIFSEGKSESRARELHRIAMDGLERAYAQTRAAGPGRQ
ncbi:MAG TPA: hypothetical protein VIO11_02920 [Candidatus Methanoperedens sp.]